MKVWNLQILYNKDCVSDQAIIYWYQKGAKPNGKQHFLKAAEPLVKVWVAVSVQRCANCSLRAQFLQEQDEDESEGE